MLAFSTELLSRLNEYIRIVLIKRTDDTDLGGLANPTNVELTFKSSTGASATKRNKQERA